MTLFAVALSAALSAPTLAGAHVGALVVDARSGAVVFSQNAEGSFQPASTLKLIVGVAALDLLGADYSFETDALTDGTVQNGTLHGRLYLRGGGDPTLDENALDDAATTLRAQSIASVDGGLIADDSHFDAPVYPPGWVIDDLAQDYAAPVSGLSFDDNAVAISLDPGATVGSPVRIATTPSVPQTFLENDATTGAPQSQDTTALDALNDGTTRVTGSYPLSAAPGELDAAIRAPALFTLDRFRQTLATHGIAAQGSSTGATPQSARVLWRHRSVPMRELLARMWLPSDNLLAESLLEELGTASQGANDARARGITRENAWMQTQGVDLHSLTIVDGSGLSQYDRATPLALVTLLRNAWNAPNRDTILAALPVAGVRGTLKSAFAGTPLAGTVIAKTGSMSHVRTLAGFLTTADGRTLVFALLVEDWMDDSAGASAALRNVQAQFLEAARETHP